MTPWLILGAKLATTIGIPFTLAPAMTYVERRMAAFIQGRVGPNRVGPMGLLQPIADLLKFVMKEQIIPSEADNFLFRLGPLLTFAPPLIGFAVIPFGNQIGDEKLQLANLGIGVLFLMSVLSVGVYGITFGGWASNNKYSMLGSLRASAQLISYELTLGLAILMAVMLSQSVDPQVIVAHQIENGWNVFGGGNWLLMPSGVIGLLLLYITALAENNRLPFDMSECEAELVGGYHTEYGSMSLAIFMLSEYLAMVLMSGLMVTLYLGGWYFPGITDPNDHSWFGGALSVTVFVAKVVPFLVSYVWVRWTLPRFRYDQIMSLGWKGLLPLALVNVVAIAVIGVLWG
jgi:NADH-quinone oxidoreductase subunit H